MNGPDSSKTFHFEHGIPVFNNKLDEIRQAQEAAKEREDNYKAAQLALDKKMVRFTGWLVLATALTGAISVWQATISRKSADAASGSATAANRAADIANETLTEMKKGGTDTHDLALAAKAQSESTKRQAGIMGQQIALAQEVERAWVGIDGEIVPKPQIDIAGQESWPVEIPARLQNFGQSVARRVQTEFKLDDSVMSLMSREAHWRQAAAPVCERAEKRSIDVNETAVSIFPGNSEPIEPISFLVSSNSPTHVVLVIGCIVYQDSKIVHHTRVLYQAEYNPSMPTIVDGVFKIPQIVKFRPMDVDAD